MFSLSLIGLVCCLAAANCIEYDIEDRVLILNDSNFDVAIKEHKQVFVLFCLTFDKCEALAADCAKAAKQLEEEGSDIKWAKVHGNYESQLIWQYGHVFPRLTFFRDGQLVEYKGSCTVEEMTQWVKKTETPARLLTTVDDARAFVDSANVTVVGFFKDQTSVEAKEFLKAAYTIEQHSFAITSEDAVYKELGASKDGVVLFKKFDEGKNILALKPTRDKIRSFVAMNSQPLVVELTREVVEYNGEQTREGLSNFIDTTCRNSHSAEVESENDEHEEKEVHEEVHADVYDEVAEDRNDDEDELANDGRVNEHKKGDEL